MDETDGNFGVDDLANEVIERFIEFFLVLTRYHLVMLHKVWELQTNEVNAGVFLNPLLTKESKAGALDISFMLRSWTYLGHDSSLGVVRGELPHKVAGFGRIASQHAVLDVFQCVVLAGDLVVKRFFIASLKEALNAPEYAAVCICLFAI